MKTIRWISLKKWLAYKEARKARYYPKTCGCGRTISGNKMKCLRCATSAAN